MAYNFIRASVQRLSTASAPTTATPNTFSCRFRTTNMTHNGALITITASANNSSYHTLYFLGATVGDPIGILDSPAVAPTVLSTTGCTSGTWHHAGVVRASNSSRTIYLDGGSSATGTATTTPSGLNEMNIGCFKNLGSEAFDGQIAEVGIWNADLTAAEVASLAKGMTCDKIRPQNLVFYAPLVRDLQDVRGGLTITNNNTATVATHPRVYA